MALIIFFRISLFFFNSWERYSKFSESTPLASPTRIKLTKRSPKMLLYFSKLVAKNCPPVTSLITWSKILDKERDLVCFLSMLKASIKVIPDLIIMAKWRVKIIRSCKETPKNKFLKAPERPCKYLFMNHAQNFFNS